MPIAAAGVGTATLDLKLTGPGLSLTQRFAAWRLGRGAGRLPPRRQAARRRRQRDDRRRPGRRFRPRHRLGVDRRFAVRRARRAGAVAGARPLSLRLLGAGRQPRHAAALPQPDRRARASLGRRRRRRAHQAGDRPRDDAAELQRRVRPMDGRRRRRRSVARRLRHRLPDAGPRARRSPCRKPASTWRSTICAMRWSTPPIPAKAPANRSPTRSMCWRATVGR